MGRASRRSLWTAKLAGGPPPARRAGAASPADGPMEAGRAFRGVVLGIDPSLRGTGLALLDIAAAGPRLLASRTLQLPRRATFAACLGEIFGAVDEMLARLAVRHVVLERTIYVQNFQTAQILGAARGAAIVAAAVRGLEIFEYPPLRVKQAVTGFGRASKHQVARAIQQQLALEAALPADEADAAATALCHAFTWRERTGGAL